eukprot:UN04899
MNELNIFLQCLSEIMHMILPLIEGSSPTFRKHLMHDLFNLTLNWPHFGVIRQSIPCLCVLCEQVSRDTSSIHKFQEVFST